MPRPPAEIYERVRLRVREIITTAMRADPDLTRVALANAPQRSDRRDADFARNARRLVLAASIALDAGLEVHRRVPGSRGAEVCRSCGTTEICPTVRRIADTLAAYLPRPVAVDRAEAWRLADAYLDAAGHGLLVGIDEIPDGFVACAVSGPASAGEAAVPEGAEVLVIDRRTGRITRWPALPLDELATHYARYLAGQTTGAGARGRT
ncbi:MAG TPA: hypothetical protein VFU43_19985 [Streptosporangiaceae bacterium]|nr:hypothetical protein [Streptosporangiaceae bacterium]